MSKINEEDMRKYVRANYRRVAAYPHNISTFRLVLIEALYTLLYWLLFPWVITTSKELPLIVWIVYSTILICMGGWVTYRTWYSFRWYMKDIASDLVDEYIKEYPEKEQ